MKYLVRWRIEGETLIDSDSVAEACDRLDEHLRDAIRNPRTQQKEFEVLDCTLVDRGDR